MKRQITVYAIVLLFCAYTSNSLASAAETKSADENFNELCAQLEPILKKYYPKAKVKKTDSMMHYEFKTRNLVNTAGKEIATPQTDGIVLDIEVKPGKLKRKEQMPLTTNETLYYSILWAPYSEKHNSHLQTELFCPHDIPITVVDEFKEAINQFCLEKDDSIKNSLAQEQPPWLDKSGKEPGEKPAVPVIASKPAHDAVQKPTETKSDSEPEIKLPKDGMPIELGIWNEVTTPPTDKSETPPPPPKEEPKPEVKVALPKAPPKPSAEYFKGWFKTYYAAVSKANYIQEVAHYYSTGFRTKALAGIDKLTPQQGYAAFKKFRFITLLKEWKIDKVKNGPYGCQDLIVIGSAIDGHPAYIIYRMIPDNGNWRIDSGIFRAWYSSERPNW